LKGVELIHEIEKYSNFKGFRASRS
jgi:hypothetical protein